MKVKAIIEMGKDGTYDAYLDPAIDVGFGLLGQGKTVKEAVDDFYTSCDEMKELYAELDKPFPKLEFEFKHDVASFLNYYSGIISFAGLGRLTGVNERQLSHYANGYRHPRPTMARKIETALHNFSNELRHVSFNV